MGRRGNGPLLPGPRGEGSTRFSAGDRASGNAPNGSSRIRAGPPRWPPEPAAASAGSRPAPLSSSAADTGPTHLAAAAGTPTVALYGLTDPERFGPVGARVRILRDGSGAYNAGLAGLPGLTADAVLTPPSRSSTSGRTPGRRRGGSAPPRARPRRSLAASGGERPAEPRPGGAAEGQARTRPFSPGETVVSPISGLKIEGR
ncbi:MAG: hypothetical protein IPN83_12465 [Holophagales bacterium]|nr:hypothetical protein [Holophagales bacterium]